MQSFSQLIGSHSSCLHGFELWRESTVPRLSSGYNNWVSNATSYLPTGFHTLTVHLTVNGAAQYIEFLKQAFDAVELTRSRSADGRLLGHRFSSAVVHPKRRTDWLSRLGGTAT